MATIRLFEAPWGFAFTVTDTHNNVMRRGPVRVGLAFVRSLCNVSGTRLVLDAACNDRRVWALYGDGPGRILTTQTDGL